MLAGVHHLVVPVRALHEPDDERLLARGRPPTSRAPARAAAATRAGTPGSRPRPTAPRAAPARPAARTRARSVASTVSTDSMSMWRWAPSSFARTSSGRIRRAASSRPTSGASGRSSGVSAETFTDRFTRGRRPIESASSTGRSGHDGAAPASVSSASMQRVRVAVRLGLGDRGLAEQVERDRGAVVPQVADRLQSRLRALSDDEAVRHVADPGCGRRAQRRAARLRAGHLHRRLDRRRAVVHLLEVAGQVPRQVVERAAGGGDVHEAEQRGAQLGVLRGQLHRALVDHAERMARASGESRVDRAPYLLKLGLHDSESYSPGYRPTMPSLVLGPVLRYVGETDAVLWVETDSACEVEILGTKERTFCVCGHHYALVCCGDLERGAWHEYEVHLDGERVWPRADGWPPSAFHTYPKESPLRVMFGSCRVAAPHEPPYSLRKDEDERGREVDALHTLAFADARRAARGVARRAADARRPGVRRRGVARHARVHRDAPRHLRAARRRRARLRGVHAPLLRELERSGDPLAPLHRVDDDDLRRPRRPRRLEHLGSRGSRRLARTTGGTSTSRARSRRTGSTSTSATSRPTRTRTTSSWQR